MIRELLFRGKAESNNEWVVGNTIINDYDIHQVFIRNRSKGFDQSQWEEVQNATVGMFTGILDRNGKRIFEHDIVRRHTVDEYNQIGTVFYDEKAACFKIRWHIVEIPDNREPGGFRRIESFSCDKPENFIYRKCFEGQNPYIESYSYELLGNEFDNKKLLEL